MPKDAANPSGFFEKHHDKIEFGAPTGCWLWAAHETTRGYGQTKVRGKNQSVHRLAFEDDNGPGSAHGLVVRHRCDTPLCVNPAHLEVGTVADNNRDMRERGRQSKGESNGQSKLTKDDVLAIRDTYVFGSSTHGMCALGQRFGVNHSLISKIVHREVWAHI